VCTVHYPHFPAQYWLYDAGIAGHAVNVIISSFFFLPYRLNIFSCLGKQRNMLVTSAVNNCNKQKKNLFVTAAFLPAAIS
jgi:hypothetical protein